MIPIRATSQCNLHRTGEEERREALSQITENRKVETRKWLIFREPIFGFCLQKSTLRQSCHAHGGTTMYGLLPIDVLDMPEVIRSTSSS